MQIHRIPVHERDFVILANRAVQDRRLSHTARGILALVLSLPDGIQENVRTLSDKYPDGRAAVAKAIAELRRLGYWVTSTRGDPETGKILSSVDVYELPGGAATTAKAVAAAASAVMPMVVTVSVLGSVPVPTRPGPGGWAAGGLGAGDPGTSPYGEKEQEKDEGKPSLIPWRRGKRKWGGGRGQAPGAASIGSAVRFAGAAGSGRPGDGGAGWAGGAGGSGPSPQEAEAARVLRRLKAVDARLRLGERQVRELVPAVCRWLTRGATVVEITDALTEGLPPKLYSARHLLADRLERKLPPVRRRWRTYAECGSPGCGGVLPAGQEAGICSGCALGTGTGAGTGSRAGARVEGTAGEGAGDGTAYVTHFTIDCATGVVTSTPAGDHAVDPATSSVAEAMPSGVADAAGGRVRPATAHGPGPGPTWCPVPEPTCAPTGDPAGDQSSGHPASALRLGDPAGALRLGNPSGALRHGDPAGDPSLGHPAGDPTRDPRPGHPAVDPAREPLPDPARKVAELRALLRGRATPVVP